MTSLSARLFNAGRVKGRFLLPFLLLLGVLVAGCGGGGGTAATSNADVATVGSLHIAKTRFVDEMQRARARLESQKQKFPKQGTTEYEQLKAQAIWLLVLEKARELEANKLGIDVTDQQVTQRIASIKKDQFGGSDAKFKQELAKEGLSEAETRAIVRDLLVSQQLTTHITQNLKVSDSAVKDYFDQHKSEYSPTRQVQYILVGKNKTETAADLKAQGKNPAKDKAAAKQVAAAYDDPQKTAEQIYADLQKGTKFATLAKKYSHDDSTKNSGGNLTAQKTQLVKKFADIAFTMKTGTVAKPFETPEYGWFVVKANGPVKNPTEKTEATTIRQTLLQQDQNTAITEWASNLAKKICTGGKITYQIGYTPNPDPCVQYTTPATTTG
jgi:parvulin-like peptidyl-prolyl isomerase